MFCYQNNFCTYGNNAGHRALNQFLERWLAVNSDRHRFSSISISSACMCSVTSPTTSSAVTAPVTARLFRAYRPAYQRLAYRMNRGFVDCSLVTACTALVTSPIWFAPAFTGYFLATFGYFAGNQLLHSPAQEHGPSWKPAWKPCAWKTAFSRNALRMISAGFDINFY